MNMQKQIFFIFLFLLNVSFNFFAQSSKIDLAKESLTEKNYEKAKEAIDAAILHVKTKDKVETWYVKGLVYNSFDNDPKLKSQYSNYREEALLAFKKSKELGAEEFLKYVLTYNGGTDPVLYIYNSYYQEGAKYYNEKNFLAAATAFQKALDLNTKLAQEPQSNRPLFDTGLIVNLAVAYENAGDKKNAAAYYEKLAEAKISGDVYSQIYRWLCFYFYKTSPDSIKLNKYIYLGNKLYPKDDFYGKLKLDIIRNKNTSLNKEELFEGYENALAQDPSNLDILKFYVGDLFNYLHPNSGKKPENSSSKGQRLEELYKTLINLDVNKKHEYTLDLGKHYYNEFLLEQEEVKPQNIIINNLSEKLFNLNKSKKKDPNTLKQKKALEDELANVKKNKENIKENYLKTLDLAISNLEFAYDYYYNAFKRGELKNFEKNILKTNIDLLITCFSEKKDKQKEEFYDQKYLEIK